MLVRCLKLHIKSTTFKILCLLIIKSPYVCYTIADHFLSFFHYSQCTPNIWYVYKVEFYDMSFNFGSSAATFLISDEFILQCLLHFAQSGLLNFSSSYPVQTGIEEPEGDVHCLATRIQHKNIPYPFLVSPCTFSHFLKFWGTL